MVPIIGILTMVGVEGEKKLAFQVWFGRTTVEVDLDGPAGVRMEMPIKTTATPTTKPTTLKNVFEKLRIASLNNESDIEPPRGKNND